MKKTNFILRIIAIFILTINVTTSELIVDISEQRLYFMQNDKILESFPISTSKYGEGSVVNSFKTPLGLHEIKEKIGENAEINSIFISRINTMRKAEIYKSIYDSSNDYVTSRILWLSGLEVGLNKGSGIDSYDRYIYIHGTHEEGLIGQKASDGCIRMFNKDVVHLFNIVSKGTKVYIKA